VVLCSTVVLVLGSTAAAAEMECVRGDCGDGVRPSVHATWWCTLSRQFSATCHLSAALLSIVARLSIKLSTWQECESSQVPRGGHCLNDDGGSSASHPVLNGIVLVVILL